MQAKLQEHGQRGGVNVKGEDNGRKEERMLLFLRLPQKLRCHRASLTLVRVIDATSEAWSIVTLSAAFVAARMKHAVTSDLQVGEDRGPVNGHLYCGSFLHSSRRGFVWLERKM